MFDELFIEIDETYTSKTKNYYNRYADGTFAVCVVSKLDLEFSWGIII